MGNSGSPENGESNGSQNEIRDRTGGDGQHPAPIVGAEKFLALDVRGDRLRRRGTVELDVTTKGYRAKAILGVTPAKFENRGTKADRKNLNRDSTCATHGKVTELVKENERAEQNDNGDHRVGQERFQRFSTPFKPNASTRADDQLHIS